MTVASAFTSSFSTLRALARLVALGVLLATILPAQVLIATPLMGSRQTLPRLLMRGMNKIMGIHATFNGVPIVTRGPTIYIGNHLSYIDMNVIMAGHSCAGASPLLPRVPLLKSFHDTMDTVWLEKTNGKIDLARVHEQIARRLNRGRNILVFPEGTSSDGTDVRPFKAGVLTVMFSNLSSVPLEKPVAVQPFVIRVARINGQEVRSDAARREMFNWYARWTPAGFWKVLQQKSIDVEVTGLPVMSPDDYKSREEFTEAAAASIRNKLLTLNAA